jgi:hypothetical protein
LVLLIALSAVLASIALNRDETPSSSDVRTPSEVTPRAIDDNLPSWNPNVECAAVRRTIPDILGVKYPAQSLAGAPYQRSGTAGGITNQRALSPPCTITNISGVSQTTFVEVDNVWISSFGVQTTDCATTYANVNGGGTFPGGKKICDNLGTVYPLGTTSGFIMFEVDHDWVAKGYCGPGVPPCDNTTIAGWVSSGQVSVDIQGFVYWDGENWEIHATTGVRYSTGVQATVEPSTVQTTRNHTASALVRVYGTSSDLVSLSVSGCPTDTVCTLSPTNGPAHFTSTLRIATGPAASLGSFDVPIVAANASLSDAVVLRLKIADRALLAFRRGDGGPFNRVEDTYIYNGTPNANFGSDTKMYVDGVDCIAKGTICKSLVKFPSLIGTGLGQVPSNARIVNASLQLVIKDVGVTEDLYQVTEAWSESTATWNGFVAPGSPGTRSREFSFAPTRLGAFSLNITAIVQRWAYGEANQGVLLAQTHWNGVDYQASEFVRDRPRLTVQFVPGTPPPPTPPLSSFTFGAVGDLAAPGNTSMVGLSKRLAAANGSFLLAIGDLSYVGQESAWCTSIKSGTKDVLVLAGNHDLGGSEGDIAKFVQFCPFTLNAPLQAGPGTPGYGYEYYFDYPATNPLARFILMSPGISNPLNYSYAPGSVHWNFVVNAVNSARSSGIPWVVVGDHKPCINDGTANPCDMTQALFDKLVDLKVDLILQAHTHTYQRSKQLAHGPACPSVLADNRFDGDCIVDNGTSGTYAAGAGSVVVTDGVGGNDMHDVPLDGSDPELGYLVQAMGSNGNTQRKVPGYGSVVYTVSSTGIDARTDFCPAGTTDGAGNCAAQQGTVFRDAFTIRRPSSLVLSYDMETLTADGRMMDLSGRGNHGTLAGTTDVAGKVGRARHFNAGERITSSSISVPSVDFTAAAWFNWTTNPSPSYSGIHGGGFSWELRVFADGRFGATFYQSIGPDVFTDIVSPLSYNDGTWHHAAAVLRSGLVELYVDGVLVAQDATKPIASVRPSTITEIGRVASNFVGSIDEVRVFSRALTADEIAALAPPPPPRADGLIMSYDMETLLPSGWMTDLSGLGHHGLLTGTTDVAGKVGRARHFDAGERITASTISVPLANFTVAAWFNWTTNPSPSYGGIKGGGYSWELRIMADGRFGATFYQSIGPDVFTDIVSPLAYDDGTWHHAAAVLRSGLVELFIDGLLVARDTTNPIASVRPSTSTEVGRVASGFVGGIDEVRVYSRALSADEIGALAPPPPSRPDGLVLSYDMETLLPNGHMMDLSGLGHHGTLTGTTDVAGKVGRARHFNGGDRITAPAISVPVADFTVAAWFNWTTNPSPSYSGIHGGGFSWELRVFEDGRFGATFYQSIGPDVFTDIRSPLVYNDGAWHHAAAVLRNGLVELYVDGALVAHATGSPITSVRASTQVVIGQVASYFVGAVDEVRIFSRALSGAEISAIRANSAFAVQYSQASPPGEATGLFSPLWNPIFQDGVVLTLPSNILGAILATTIAASKVPVFRRHGVVHTSGRVA